MSMIAKIARRALSVAPRRGVASLAPSLGVQAMQMTSSFSQPVLVAGRSYSSSAPVLKSAEVVEDEEEEYEVVPLGEALANEIQEEASEDQVDQELEDIKSQVLAAPAGDGAWSIVDTPGHGLVKLTSTHEGPSGKETIEVTFDCQDEADMDDMEQMDLASLMQEKQAGADGGDDEDAGELNFGVNFTVSVSKEGQEVSNTVKL